MKRAISILSLSGLIALFICSLAFPIQAQERTLTISPLIVEESLDPGQGISGVFKVRNDSPSKVTVSISLKDFLPKGEKGQQIFLSPEENDTTWSLADWICITTPSFNLEPKETREVNYTVQVPENAEPGGHYAAIFAEAKGEKPEEGTVVLARAKLGCLLLVTARGDIIERGNIEEFSTSKNIYSAPPVDFAVRFKNTGTVHVKPRGDIKIYSWTGRLQTSLPVNEKMGNVLPVSIRKFEPQWTPTFALGKYKATCDLVYGTEAKELSAETSFWLVPWSIIVIAALVIIFIIIIAKTIDIVPQGAKRRLAELERRLRKKERK